MWIEVLILGIIIGLARGGRISNLDKISIKGGLFIALAIIIQLIPFFFSTMPLVKLYCNYFVFFGALIAASVVLFNIKTKGMPLVFIGSLLNLITLFFNDFKMPINLNDQVTTASLAEMKLNIISGNIPNYVLFADATKWTTFLGKTIILPPYYPFTSFISIPDLFIAAGVIWLIQNEMQNNLIGYGDYGYYYH